jgi:protein involved in polysaccharide export with SLBB domain
MRLNYVLISLFYVLALSGFASAVTEPVQRAVPASNISVLPSDIPFGAELFQGNFSKDYFDELNSDYQIMPGDRVRVQLWGAHSFDGILEVDARGNLFLPEIGPLYVDGLRHADLESQVLQKIRSVYTSNVEVYANLLKPQPVALFITGFVDKPGRYSGGATDSVLYYLDQAGGIDPLKGSYRDIRIIRNGKLLKKLDLYPFLLEGILDRPRLETGDTILVGEKHTTVSVDGQVRRKAMVEFYQKPQPEGSELADLVSPLNNASHVSVTGTRNGAPFNVYISLSDFSELPLADGDRVRFHADIPAETIMVAAEGAIIGASRYPVHKSTKLKALLSHIAVEPELANLDGIHLRRKSVAVQQKNALNEALRRLEQSSLTATSSSVDEASIRVREAELIAQFVEKAKQIQPDGIVVVGHEGDISDIYLEDGDEIIIPAKSDVVMISGEVMMPQSVVWQDGVALDDYISGAGGYSDRADKKRLLLVRPNGEVLMAKETSVSAGDQILVLPRFDSKNMQVLKDISQILYQVAIAAKVALNI